MAVARYHILLGLCLVIFGAVNGEDLPCASVMAEKGYICVCNATYCDTLEPLITLEPGVFYHMMTSESSPGFTKSIKPFSDVTARSRPVTGDLSSDVSVFVDASVEYQEFVGMGSALTDSSSALLKQLPAAAYDKFMEAHFGVTGLEYNLLRLPISSSDFSTSFYSYDNVTGDENLTHFNLTWEDYEYKVPFIRKAQSLSQRGIKTFWTTWTAPDWMKTNNLATQGYLQRKHYPTFAKYYVKFLQAYKELDLTPWAVMTGNEPTLPLYFGSSMSMSNTLWMPAQQRYWLKKYLYPMMQEAGFGDVLIFLIDDERPFLDWWADRMFRDEDVRKMVAGVALHWYLDVNTTLYKLNNFRKKYPEMKMLYTEASINNLQTSGRVVELGSWSRGKRFINSLFETYCHYVSSYNDWNIALNHDGGPVGPDGISLDASIIINVTSGEFYKQPYFYILGHFSRFVQPGARRIMVQTKQETDDPWTEECTVDAPVDRTPSAYGRFSDANTRGAEPNLGAFPTRKPDANSTTVAVLAVSNPDGSRSVIAYNPRQDPVNLQVTDADRGTFTTVIESFSMNSFVYW